MPTADELNELRATLATHAEYIEKLGHAVNAMAQAVQQLQGLHLGEAEAPRIVLPQ